jgi:hypothetical protein
MTYQCLNKKTSLAVLVEDVMQMAMSIAPVKSSASGNIAKLYQK